MKRVSVREMRATLGQLEHLVGESGEIIVTRRGRPIARVLPIEGYKPKPDHADLRAKMQRLETASEHLIAAERAER